MTLPRKKKKKKKKKKKLDGLKGKNYDVEITDMTTKVYLILRK
jgi:hypothetical protein